jgi:hypothetical protein
MDRDRDLVAEALSQEADQMITDLQVAIRCRCCPIAGLFSKLAALSGTDASDDAPAPQRARQRSDFLGLLGEHEVDASWGRGN